MPRIQWEPASVKAQLRLSSLRLGQLQEKKDSQGAITRRDIATLLRQRNIGLARAKAQKLMEEDALGDLLEILEMHVGLLLEHFPELDQSPSPSPGVVEAASTIIFAAPHVDLKDLSTVSELLSEHLGTDFSHSAARNLDNYVATPVMKAISAPPPSATVLDSCLEKIAHDFGVEWSPEPGRDEILNAISEIVDPQTSPIIDLPRLRQLCAHGIPDDPAWLRPRIWKLLLGVLPVLKSSWRREVQKQRESYYDLIRRLLGPFSSLPPPSDPLVTMDAVLLQVSKQLSGTPPRLFSDLVDQPEYAKLSPLDDNASDEIKINAAQNLAIRLRMLQNHNPKGIHVASTPEIRLEPDVGIPEISLSSPDTGLYEGQDEPTTLLSSKTTGLGGAHSKHSNALLRLLYLHSSINPGNISPHIASLLVPLYVVLNHEVELEDLVHVEADTFWLFEAMVGEFSELEDEDGGSVWMRRFGERLAWADPDLFNNMQVKGLDPALPHYSYRWLAPLLTHTLPLPSVFLIWDAVFSCPVRERDMNPKLDYLLDICTAMLIRARAALFRLGKGSQKSPSLWGEEDIILPPPSPLRAWELGDAFLEGMSLLQTYPLEASGGIERILQTASDLCHRRKDERKAAQSDKLSLGARLKVTMWKGFTNQAPSPDTSPSEDSEESNDESLLEGGESLGVPDKAEPLGLTSRLATTVWRGITNQSVMDPPPSPLFPTSTPSSPSLIAHQESLSPLAEGSGCESTSSAEKSSGLWSYAERLRESGAAATIAKVSSNWRAKALPGSWGRSSKPIAEGAPASFPRPSVRSESFHGEFISKLDEGRRGSLPPIDRTGIYSPPPRPLYFRPPRDSFIFPGNVNISPPGPAQSEHHSGSFMDKTRSLQSSFASLTRTQTSQTAVRSAPRPLLLSSSTPITSPPNRPLSLSAGSTPTPDRGEWADVMRLKGHALRQDSQSSVSSLSPSDAFKAVKSGRTDWDSDAAGSSRRIPLNRRSVSPMAPGFRVHQGRPMSGSSSATSSDRGLLSPPLSAGDLQGWSRIEMPESPPVFQSPSNSITNVVDSMVLSDDGLERPQNKKLVRKKTPPVSQFQAGDTSDSSVVHVPSRSPRLRSKRYTARPPNLHIHDNSILQRPITERKLSNPNSLAVEWPVEDQDIVSTPRASSFSADDHRSMSPSSSRSLRRSRKVSAEAQERHHKISTEGHETRTRKVSAGQRPRKVSNDNKDVARSTRDSSAEEGDDEGYDDLLSAYESEEGSQISSLR